MTILLDRTKALKLDCIVDYKQYMNEFAVVKTSQTVREDLVQQPMKLLTGAYTIVNVDGSYVKVDCLMSLLTNREDFKYVLEWISSLRNPTIPFRRMITYKWRR